MGRKSAIDPQYHEEIIEKYKTGDYSMRELALMYGATNRQPVVTILKQNNIDTIDRRTIQGNDLQKVKSMIDDGLSVYEIANKLDVSQKAIYTAIERLDIDYEPHYRKYNFNENSFDIIDTEGKAYWLGFIYADGHSDRTSTRIALSPKDLAHLEKLRDFLNGDMPITATVYGAVNLELNSKYMVDRMHELGVVPYRGKFNRTKKAISTHLVKHFIRGYIDGDGCITNDQRVSILGQKDILDWINEHLHEQLEVNKNKMRNRGKIMEIAWGGSFVFDDITKYLYKDAIVFLDRKMKRIKKQVNW